MIPFALKLLKADRNLWTWKIYEFDLLQKSGILFWRNRMLLIFDPQNFKKIIPIHAKGFTYVLKISNKDENHFFQLLICIISAFTYLKEIYCHRIGIHQKSYEA